MSKIECRMFKHACAFYDCAHYCTTEPNNIDYRTHSHNIAGIVNAAFACEVFIKTLLVFNGESLKNSNGHELKKLWLKFKKIDNETALYIEQKMRKCFNSKNENMFEELLTNISNAFKEYRYIYETDTGGINPQYLRFFSILLRETCCMQLYNKPWGEYLKEMKNK